MRFSIFTLSLIFLFLSFFLRPFFRPRNETHVPISGGNHSRQEPFVRRNHIIRFTDYKTVEDHRNYLQKEVKFEGWEWIERKNPSARFPTDFGVVAIEDSKKGVLVGKFEELELVKDVSLDFSYQRVVLEEKDGSFADGEEAARKDLHCNVI